MVYLVNECDLICDSCGEFEGNAESFPNDQETDSPIHCACGADCWDAVDLAAYGFKPGDKLVGAERRKVGALLGTRLTDEGVRYLKEMLEEEPRTPYQRALHRFWREEFSDYLGAVEYWCAKCDTEDETGWGEPAPVCEECGESMVLADWNSETGGA